MPVRISTPWFQTLGHRYRPEARPIVRIGGLPIKQPLCLAVRYPAIFGIEAARHFAEARLVHCPERRRFDAEQPAAIADHIVMRGRAIIGQIVHACRAIESGDYARHDIVDMNPADTWSGRSIR